MTACSAPCERACVRPGQVPIRGLVNLSFPIGTRIALATGMRRGECFGLTWKNLNLRQGTITVTQTLAKEGEVKAPKTHSGKRTISIDEKTVAHLKAWRKRQREELVKLCMEPDGTTPVCCNERGEWVNLANFERCGAASGRRLASRNSASTSFATARPRCCSPTAPI